MKKILRIVIALISVAALVAAAALIYLFTAYPKAEPPEGHPVEATPARLARGEYLAKHVTVCIDCHSTREWQYFSGPIVPGTEGKGGEAIDESKGFPGAVYAANITPAALGNWTDGELARAITDGINKNGEALFPLMPYLAYRHLSQEDLYSLIAYLRTLPPIPNEIPERRLNFPLNLIVRLIPEPATPQPNPDASDTVAYGRYLTQIAGCHFCHTPEDNGKKVPGMDFAGGMRFPFPGGDVVQSLNITPDKETGLGDWDKETFIQIFRSYSPEEVRLTPVLPGELNTVMPWTMYSGMTDDDLGAIYEFLRTVPPVKNAVERFIPKDAN